MLFRLLKSITEYEKLMDILGNPGSDELTTFLNIINHLSYFMFWIFDNLYILTLMKFLKKDKNFLLKVASYFWLSALISLFFANLRKYHNLKKNNENQGKIDCFFNMGRSIGDLPTVLNNSGILQKIGLKENLNEGIIGISGFFSALMSSIQMIKRNSSEQKD